MRPTPIPIRNFIKVLQHIDGCRGHKVLAAETEMHQSSISRALHVARSFGVVVESVVGKGYRVVDWGPFDPAKLKAVKL